MEILSKILDSLPKEPVPVKQLAIGVHWTLVSSRHCALGSTLIESAPHGHSRVRDVGRLHEKSAQELAQLALSDNLLEASVGITAMNSLLDIDEARVEQVNAADIIARESRDKNLVIVGHFPFVDKMKSIARDCRVIEKRMQEGDFPEESAREFIPAAHVVAITGTAFINHTIDSLLSLCRPESLVIILGPSTPLSPLLFEKGVSYLSGSRVIDEQAALLTIQQGAIFPQVNGVRLITMNKGK